MTTTTQPQAQASLRRLGREVLDLYQLHLPDPQIPVEESWGAMTRLVEEGPVRYIGVSNFPPELVERCERERHVDSVQLHFSLLYREDCRGLLPLCRALGTGILAYGLLGFGVLAGSMTPQTRFADDDWRSGKVPVPRPALPADLRSRQLRAAPADRRGATSPRAAQGAEPGAARPGLGPPPGGDHRCHRRRTLRCPCHRGRQRRGHRAEHAGSGGH